MLKECLVIWVTFYGIRLGGCGLSEIAAVGCHPVIEGTAPGPTLCTGRRYRQAGMCRYLTQRCNAFRGVWQVESPCRACLHHACSNSKWAAGFPVRLRVSSPVACWQCLLRAVTTEHQHLHTDGPYEQLSYRRCQVLWGAMITFELDDECEALYCLTLCLEEHRNLMQPRCFSFTEVK